MKTVSQPSMLAEKKELWKEIAAHPFLAGMNPHHLELLSRYATRKNFAPGEIIFRAGEPAHGFYLIQTGTVALEGSVMEHGQIATDTVHAGEPLGWSWLFPPYRWHFDARAMEPTTAIFFDSDQLRQHYNEDITLGHDLSQRICKVMAHRLQATRRKLIETVQRSGVVV
ncbi:MAG TPA: cyclic nucleotide-binding domain-containing protein [Chthoniobacterales bacterium]|jgi:CRP/FNR family transcriptional regulator, cyclic AMP receptor protein|nr:cyclic nucleotide-binding domain-containing protein [Chthoniobacterales bacterium]